MNVMRHWVAETDAHRHNGAVEVAFTEAEAQEYRDAGWTVWGPCVLEPPRGAVDAYLGELVAESRAICEREGVKNLAEWIGKTVLARVTGEGQ